MSETLILYSNSQDASYNLALEEYISIYYGGKDKYILFLWQNNNSVIIGRNQNARNECCFDALREYGTKLVRRNTGGGAVYHDMGNLNFSFICPREHYDVRNSIQIIKRAVSAFGIESEYSGRNDLLVNGSKFSGNAFLTNAKIGLHHGTILVNTDFDIMEKVLRVSKEKIEPKGIGSIRSRVINLKSVCPSITVEAVSKAIILEFKKQYAHDKGCVPVSEEQLFFSAENDKFKKIVEKYTSESWNLGDNFNYTYVVKDIFSWGICEIRILLEEGIIKRIGICTDSLFPSEIEKIERTLLGKTFVQLQTEGIGRELDHKSEVDNSILKDIVSLINKR